MLALPGGVLDEAILSRVEAIAQQELAALPEFDKAVEREAYDASRIPRILKQMSLIMQDELRSMVLTSMGAYLAMVRGYSTPAEELDVNPAEWAHADPGGTPPLLPGRGQGRLVAM